MSQESTAQKFQPLRWFLHALVLWAFAVAQPLYAKVAENLPFLLAHRADGLDVFVYAMVLLLPIPVLLGLVVWLCFGLSSVLGRLVRGLVLFGLVFFIVFPILGNTLQLNQWLASLVAVAAALIVAFAYDTRFWKGLFDILTPAPVLFVAFFLFFSPVRLLLFDSDAQVEGDSQDRMDVPVVLVLLDEFPTHVMLSVDGQLDRDRLPGFARLADSSTWYPWATTVAEATVMAVPAALSGVLPAGERHQPPVFQSFPENIFDQVSPERRIWAVENGTRLCRPGRCESPDTFFVAGNEYHWPTPTNRYRSLILDSAVIWGHMSLPERARRALLPELGAQWQGFLETGDEGMETVAANDSPHSIRWNQRMVEVDAFMNALQWVGPGSFHYLHTLLPHAPWIHLSDGRIYELSRAESIYGMIPEHANDTGVKHMWYDDEWATIIGKQRFLLQLQFVDQLIDRMLDQLESNPNFADMMVIVTADHGSAFTSGTSRRALTDENLAEVLSVPLFIKYPGQREGRVDTGPAELLDISPTIRDVLGLNLNGLDGQSLVNDDRGDLRPRLVDDRGEYSEFDPVQFQRNLVAVTQRMHRNFDWTGNRDFPRLAEFAHWYDRALTDLGEVIDSSSQTLELARSGLWQHIDPASRVLPARILGQLQEAEINGQVFVAGVNGRIAGFGKAYTFPGADNTLEIMLEPSSFREGRNEVEIFRLATLEDSIMLERVFSNTGITRLVSGEDSRLELHRDEDVILDVTRGPPYGIANLLFDADQNIYILQGWALNPLSAQVADKVHVFVDSDLVGTAVPSDPRPDVVERFGQESVLRSGFRMPLPLAVDPLADYGVMRVIAVDDRGNAAQLPVSGIAKDDIPFTVDPDYRPASIPDPASDARARGLYLPGWWIEPAAEDFKDLQGVRVVGNLTGSGNGLRWTGRDLEFCFQIAGPTGRFRLDLEVMPFISQPVVLEQTVIVSTDERVIAHWLLDEREIQKLNATFDHELDGDDGEICIQFEMPDAAVPANLGISPDKRTLGLAFQRLRLVRM